MGPSPRLLHRTLLLAPAFILLAAGSPARAQEPLALHVQYPPAGSPLTASDSTFVFGRVEGAGDGPVTLSVNGHSVPVQPGGGWLAFVPVEPDSFTFRIRAEAGGRTASADHTVWVPRPATAPGDTALGYKPESASPTGWLELYAGDTVHVGVIAAPGQRVYARLGEDLTELHPEPSTDENPSRAAFGIPRPAEEGSGSWLRYRADVYATLSGAVADTIALVFGDTAGQPRVVPIAGVTFLDPTEVRTAVLHDDSAATGRTDHRVLARAGPGGVYDVFVPNGTPVALGRFLGGRREIVLGPGKSAWVDPGDLHPMVGMPRPASEIAVVRTRLAEGWSEILIPLSERLPFDVEQHLDPVRYRITIYGATADTDIIRYLYRDPLIRAVEWAQPENGVFTLDVTLAGKTAWGWRVGWEATNLVIGFRHAPPALSDHRYRSALHGVTVIVDPGHNPDTGAVGPTGFEERNANLEIALRLGEVLEGRGARVVMTRATADSTLGLYDRTNLAVAEGGEVFVSIHNNALPDGVNPFANNGTSVLFYHPQSRPLAHAILGELLDRTGLPDYGYWHDNLAVTRMNEMPSVLVEGAFMMIPDQEARLRTPAFQDRIARAVADGVEKFLREAR